MRVRRLDKIPFRDYGARYRGLSQSFIMKATGEPSFRNLACKINRSWSPSVSVCIAGLNSGAPWIRTTTYRVHKRDDAPYTEMPDNYRKEEREINRAQTSVLCWLNLICITFDIYIVTSLLHNLITLLFDYFSPQQG